MALQFTIFFALATLGAYADVASLKYLPMFGIGVALASVWTAFPIGSPACRGVERPCSG